MKKLIIITIIIFLTLPACKKKDTINDTKICGVNDPATELPWLAEIIAKAETDTTGNYLGTIYLEYYKNIPVFFTNMGMGSGGAIGHWFNCDGSRFTLADKTELYKFYTNMKLNKIIYTNFII